MCPYSSRHVVFNFTVNPLLSSYSLCTITTHCCAFFPVEAIAACSLKKQIEEALSCYMTWYWLAKKKPFPWWIHLIYISWNVKNCARFETSVDLSNQNAVKSSFPWSSRSAAHEHHPSAISSILLDAVMFDSGTITFFASSDTITAFTIPIASGSIWFSAIVCSLYFCSSQRHSVRGFKHWLINLYYFKNTSLRGSQICSTVEVWEVNVKENNTAVLWLRRVSECFALLQVETEPVQTSDVKTPETQESIQVSWLFFKFGGGVTYKWSYNCIKCLLILSLPPILIP